MKARILDLLLVASVFWGGAPSPVMAVVLTPTTLEELTTSADGVFLGRVIQKESVLDPERKLIFTKYTFSIERTISGAPASTVVLTELGGEVGDLGMGVPGSPEYELGEEAVVFYRAGKQRLMTLRWSEGKFRIVEGGDGSREVVQPSVGVRMPLEAFATRVARILAAGGKEERK